LRVVDENDRARREGGQRGKKRVQSVAQLIGRRLPAAREIVARECAEIDQQRLQQIVDGQERIREKGSERPPIELLDDSAAQRGLADAVRSCDDHDARARAD
jgi:hypothetical protein